MIVVSPKLARSNTKFLAHVIGQAIHAAAIRMPSAEEFIFNQAIYTSNIDAWPQTSLTSLPCSHVSAASLDSFTHLGTAFSILHSSTATALSLFKAAVCLVLCTLTSSA